jgi:transcription elongation factor GreA
MHTNVQIRATIGSRVRLGDADGVEEYVIAPEREGDPTAGRISADSPLGRAVLGHQAGERLQVRTPGGVRKVQVLEVC